MIRKAFVMNINEGVAAEYERRHNPISPQLEQVLREHGVSNYSIFLHEGTGLLFAYAEIESESRWAAVAQSEACKAWWQFMAPLMHHNPDSSPVSQGLREVFHLV
jgi:L-rhamnose mutarotase